MNSSRIARRLGAGVCLLLLSACALPAHQDSEPEQQEIGATPVRVTVAHKDERQDLPNFAFVQADAGPRAGLRPQQVAWSVLRGAAATYRLGPKDLEATRLTQVHDTGKGPIVARFEQRIDDAPVFLGGMSLALTRDNEPVAISGHLSQTKNLRRAARANVQASVARAARELLGLVVPVSAVSAPTAEADGYATYSVDAGVSSALTVSRARVRKVWFQAQGALEEAHYIELSAGVPGRKPSVFRSFVVSAVDAAVLFQKDMVAHEAFTYKVYAQSGPGFAPDDGPQGDTTPYVGPKTFVTPRSVTLANVPFSKNDPWLPAGAQDTLGNNVNAYADLTDPDGFSLGDRRPKVTSPGKFEPGSDPLQPVGADANIDQATLQLFYTTNYLHDVFYDAGFDEASGNAQTDNFGRGGLGKDPIKAEAQDSSGRNNANCYTPADGDNPRIQMFLWDGITPTRVEAGALGNLAAQPASFAPTVFATSGQLVAYQDGTDVSTDGCEAATNASALAGKIALIDRGKCTFVVKVQNATNAGAIGVLVANNVSGPAPYLGANQGTPTTVPTLGISDVDGAALRTALGAGAVNVKLVREAAQDRDGSLDTGIVAHEWAHYLSNRLVGNGTGLFNSQGGGMGEGWSDFVSLLTLIRAEDVSISGNDVFQGTYAASGWAAAARGESGYYFGVRRYPYATDMAKNPLTFRHIADGQALPDGPTVAFGEDGRSNSEVHASGEVWASMLWECFGALLRDKQRLTFDQALTRMRGYLVASLKLTPPSPTFIEARDAVLAVALAGDKQDFFLFAQAFAKRGAGIGAVAPGRDSADHVGVVESFATGAALEFASASLSDEGGSCDDDGIVDATEIGRLKVTLRNAGTETLSNITGRFVSKNPNVQFIDDASAVRFPVAKPFTNVEAQVRVKVVGAAKAEAADFYFEATDPLIPNKKLATGGLLTRVHYDVNEQGAASDDFDLKSTPWVATGDKRLENSRQWQRVFDGINGVWSMPDREFQSDQYLTSPPLDVGQGSLVLTIKHRFSFDTRRNTYRDGGVIEFSTDNGKTWKDAGDAAGYVGTIELRDGSNPLAERKAYAGLSAGYPGYIETVVDLGDRFAGKTVLMRFRLGTDSFRGDKGWDIDSLKIDGLVNTPFPAIAEHTCQFIPPGPEAQPTPTPVPTPEGPTYAISAAGACAATPGGTGPTTGAFGVLLALCTLMLRRRRR
jgi:hypothetical protein